MNFDQLIKKINLIEEQIVLKNLRDVNIFQISTDMEKIEKDNFQSGWNDDRYGIEDDSNKSGFFGYGLFDDIDDKIKGYVYGYPISEDEYEDIDDIPTDNFREIVKIYDNRYDNINSDNFRQTFTPSNTFYISNMVIDKPYRTYLLQILKRFFTSLKQNKIKYIQFDALKDTENLLFNPNGTPKIDRMRRYNFKIIASAKTEYDSLMTIIEL
jgi:hypothetical protein